MLDNKLNITSNVELANEEEKITKLKAIELFDSNKIMKLNLVLLMAYVPFINSYLMIFMILLV